MFIYTMCGVYFAISTLKKVSKRHFTCRFYLPTIAPATRYLKTTSPDGMPVSYRSLSEHQRMHFRHVPSCPPRRLPPRFSRRFPPAPVPISCLPATTSQFAMFLPADRTLTHIDSSRRIIQLRLHHLTPSMPPARPDIAAARSPRRMAPRGAGRVSMACPFGAYRHGSRWCSSDIPDAVPYVRSRRSSGQRIPDTDIEARETDGMLYACRTTISCDTGFTGISHFQPKSPPVQFRPVRSGAYHMLGMGMALPRVLESRSGHRPWRLGTFPLIAGRRGGRGENRMSLEDTWHVAR